MAKPYPASFLKTRAPHVALSLPRNLCYNAFRQGNRTNITFLKTCLSDVMEQLSFSPSDSGLRRAEVDDSDDGHVFDIPP